MQAIIAEEDASMEELDDHNLQMEETAQGLLRTPSLKESYHSDTDFMTDDRSSAASGLDVADRLTYLEQRMQMQEDEIQLLKLALADVLKRLNISEEHQAAAAAAAAAGRKTPGAKARPVSLALPPRTMSTSSSASLKKSSTVPSSATARNYSPAPFSFCFSFFWSHHTITVCTITPFLASISVSLLPHFLSFIPWNSFFFIPNLCPFSGPPRHISPLHLVTMQIYLSPLARKTGSSEEAKSASAVPAYRGPVAGPGPPLTKRGGQSQKKRSTPSFTLNLQKTVTGQSSAQEMSSYISPVKSPSQYFQICY
uniref:EMAP like 1 n=1 Tax=Poecilia reticulata TaxID=8081 RepID=A0A3P9PNU2_POERE